MSSTKVLTSTDTLSSNNRIGRPTRPVLRLSAQAMTSPNYSSGISSASGSRERLPSKEATFTSRNAGRGHADASFPTTPSGPSSQVGGRQLPMTQPSVDFPHSPNSPCSRHQRARTTTAPPSAAPPNTLAFPRTHSRASSSISQIDSLRSPRARVLSLSSFASTNSCDAQKAEALTPVSVEGEETIGSFAPTSCPRQHIHSLLGSMPHHKFFSVARRRLGLGLGPSGSRSSPKPHIFDHNDDNASSLDDEDSPPPSPLPSICRTPSSESHSEASDYFPTAPSSVGPATPASHSAAPSIRRPSHGSLTPASLAEIESKSKFRVRTSCSTCHRPGSNYPCCPRCGEMWCSRECRLQSTAGKRHVCRK
ncbi:hypothetical protein BXZ70DRAFT_921677 [Cristinia sonorae]|uniref:Uncharacterized protein n=1 Tax=Cristinia sonorae TaxID=1940300 RepID=A0A8K0XSZ8_9AGAR|nr:hypothetical protein BXZ70DRAFT_921677 [Cristinia sonorae]